MVKPLIFLDIDGVFNDHSVMENKYCTIQYDKMLLFNQLAPADIVITSAWRYLMLEKTMTLRGFTHLLSSHGLSENFNIIDRLPPDTPGCPRGVQIHRWLQFNIPHNDRKTLKYVVLDDLDLDITLYNLTFVQTIGTVGLTQEDIERCKQLL